ncbi:hypothetical protein EAF00_008594 [Botryotinia globosa]|nr:hypothetical protein EAF00_008594 [Botryotinia globosa]
MYKGPDLTSYVKLNSTYIHSVLYGFLHFDCKNRLTTQTSQPPDLKLSSNQNHFRNSAAMCIEQWTIFPCGHKAIRIQGCLQQQQTNCHPPLCPFYQVTFFNAPIVFKPKPDQRNEGLNLGSSQFSGLDGNKIEDGTQVQAQTIEKMAKNGWMEM